jgi:hypothetical protein
MKTEELKIKYPSGFEHSVHKIFFKMEITWILKVKKKWTDKKQEL